ncbi:hypothetical protein BJ322DRAFT_1021354 [Thelephora terrestris]|uniref:Uncharacterized protein n=1 Tax=Thelephora terrestris TaxID=56493 RepID=A0A9P6HF80_9AGAM|nr:hypothetical protein BJ322DRAFT_1021354 [Thelephora terrestris]
MYNDIFPPDLHHALSDSSMSDLLSGVHGTRKIGGPPSGSGSSCGAMDSIPDTRCSSHASHPSNTSAGLESIFPWTPGVISPLYQYQEVPEEISVFDASSTIRVPYLDTDLGHGSFDSVHEFVHLDMGQPLIFYPSSPMPNTGADNSSLIVSEEMEHQPISEMTYMNRSPSMPSSALNSDGLTAWPWPTHVPDHDDHCTLGLADFPKNQATFRGLAMGAPQNTATILGKQWTRDVSPAAINLAKASPLPFSISINLCKIPQRRYASRTGDTSFLQSHVVTFSVNGVPGFNMQHALDQVFVGLDGRDEPVLENANGPASCRLLFPGYPINAKSSQIAVKNWKKDPAPIPKSKLSYEVAKRVRQCLNELVAIPIDPSADPQWTIGKGFMTFEKMYLVSVSWVSKGSLQPEIWVDTGDV